MSSRDRRVKGGMVLEDGPAAGTFSTRRAPHFLRAVVGRDGVIDLLDQLFDEPLSTESVYVYEAVGPVSDADSWNRHGTIICPTPGGSGTYRHRADVDGEQLRSTSAWRDWARAQPSSTPGQALVDVTTGKITPAATR